MAEVYPPLPTFHIVGLTGHRQLRDVAAVEKAVRAVLGGLRDEVPGEWLAMSSLAAGADMIFARTAQKLGLEWEAVLPFPPSEFQKDFTPEGWREVEGLLAEAERVRIIGERTTREDAYLDCGMEVANHCDVLVAVWDGQPARGRGGTADIVAYAREMRRPLVIVDANDFSVRRENMDRLKAVDPHIAYFNRLPPAPGAAHEVSGHDKDENLALVRAFQARVDHAASANAPHEKRLVSLTIWLHVLATALATASLAFNLHLAALPWGKLACLLGAIAVAILVRHRREQHDWMRCRLAAEIARGTLATWGLPRTPSCFDALDRTGFDQLHRSLDILQRRATRRSEPVFDEFKQRYMRERIDGQLAYFSRQQQKAVPSLERLRWGFFLCSLLALCFTAAYAIHALLPDVVAPAWVGTWVYSFGPVILPVLAAAFMSLVHVNDLHRRVARYRELQVRLETARKEIGFVQTWGSMERVVARVERMLLQEVIEWHSITSFTEAH